VWQTRAVRNPWPRSIDPILLTALAGALAIAAASLAQAKFGDADPWLRIRPIVGKEEAHLIEPGETLHDVAYQHRLGFDAIQRLNPKIDPWIPAPGTVVELPTRYLLPPVESSGLVINVPEMRLYDFTRNGPPEVHAIAVGDREDPTILGRFPIGQKRVDPVWYVPASILAERPGFPRTVPPGKDNPLGTRWMTIGETSYGIHGTNVKWSLGRGSTHGCVRLYGDEMEELFDRVPSGVEVALIYEPFKWGTNGKDLFLEVHPDLYGRVTDRLEAALALPRELDLLAQIDIDLVWQTVQQVKGVPVRVGALR